MIRRLLAWIPRPALAAVLGIGLGCATLAQDAGSPLSIEHMRNRVLTAELSYERDLEAGAGFRAYLVSYRSSGLKVYALVAVPATKRPTAGYPVLIANHGFHPEPRRYGFTAEGVDARPGDYYRGVPAAYARAGYLVVMPDYRGHNISEGFEYTEGLLATHYYTLDVLSLLAALPTLEQADLENVFMWGHSLGGEVTLRALLATDVVKGASLWAPVGATLWEQAYHYERLEASSDSDYLAAPKQRMLELERDAEALAVPHAIESGEPLYHLSYLATPLVIHHARGDRSVPYQWSERLVTELYANDKPYTFYSYDSDAHMFAGEQLRLAVERDTTYFSSLMRTVPDE